MTRVWLLLAVLGVHTACAREPDPSPADMPAEVAHARATWPQPLRALIDRANAAYAAERFEESSALFRRAAELRPELPTAWYGVYIAEHALGRLAPADSALRRARQLDTTAASPAEPGGNSRR